MPSSAAMTSPHTSLIEEESCTRNDGSGRCDQDGDPTGDANGETPRTGGESFQASPVSRVNPVRSWVTTYRSVSA